MTVRTTDGNSGEAVRRQMEIERRLRENRRKPSTVISDDAAVTGASAVGGPNPNEEGQPVRPAPEQPEEATEASEEAPEAAQDDDSNDDDEPQQEIKRPNKVFGSKDDWHAYRLANGYTAEELEGKGRDELRDLEDR